MLEPCPKCSALPCDWVNNPHIPTASQSDEALVEELARLLSNRHGLIFDEVCGYADDGEECDSSTCMGAMDEDHDVEWNRESYRRDARAILPIIHAREASARAEGRREGIEALDKWGAHKSGCNAARALPFEVRSGKVTCTCGFDDARRALAEKQP